MLDPDIFAEIPDHDWVAGFFTAFLQDICNAVACDRPVARLQSHFMRGLAGAAAGYRQRSISPTTMAYLAIIFEYGTLIMDVEVEEAVTHHFLLTILRAIDQELRRPDVRVDLPARVWGQASSETLFIPLMPAWRSLIEYCYSAYKIPRQALIERTTSIAAWEARLHAIIPALLMTKFLPTHDVEYLDRIAIPDKAAGPATYSNILRRPRRFYARLFTEQEIQRHADEQKMIEETYAHVFATVMTSDLLGRRYFAEKRAMVLSTLKSDGRLAARQRIALELHHYLSIPTVFANELTTMVESR